ncbi:MAG TPA: hypothetical protein VFQ39_15295 [Longimicrobium sp.]|nr:hypothetical protein [Longimicrobium sp.]
MDHVFDRRWMAAATLALLALGACDDSSSPPTPAQRAAAIRTLIVVGANNPSRVVRAGNTVPVITQVTDLVALPVEGAPVAFTGNGTVNPGQSDTDVNGVVSGTWTAGTVAGIQEIVSSVTGNDDVFDRTQVVVFADTIVGTLVLESARSTIPRNDTTRVVITDARDQYGNPYVLVGTQPDSPPSIEFTSLDPSIATLRSTTARTALVNGVAAGTARIVAKSDGKADTVTVTVTP